VEIIEQDATPDLDELLQVDEDAPPTMHTVPVRLTEAGTVWPPAEPAGPHRRTTVRRCPVDSDRRRIEEAVPATLIAATNPMRIRVSTSGTGMAWPIGVPYPVTHTQAVFVQCATAGQTCTIGVTEEFWAD
jgi:hypothetical protein